MTLTEREKELIVKAMERQLGIVKFYCLSGEYGTISELEALIKKVSEE